MEGGGSIRDVRVAPDIATGIRTGCTHTPQLFSLTPLPLPPSTSLLSLSLSLSLLWHGFWVGGPCELKELGSR